MEDDSFNKFDSNNDVQIVSISDDNNLIYPNDAQVVNISDDNNLIYSSYKKTIDMINSINSGSKEYNIGDYVTQVKSNLKTGVLVNVSNDAFIDFEINNINFYTGITNGLNSINSTMETIQSMDKSLSFIEGTINNILLHISVSKINYSDYEYTGTYSDFFDVNSKTGCDVSSADVSNIKSAFISIISSNNRYLSTMKHKIFSLKYNSENAGNYWNAISKVLDGYIDVIGDKKSFNSDMLKKINGILNKIQDAIDKCGYDPVTDSGRNEIAETIKKIDLDIRNLYLILWKQECTGSGENYKCFPVKDNDVAFQIEQNKQLRLFHVQELELYDDALAKIKELELELNDCFYEFQKHNAYFNSMLPSFPMLSLNDTGKKFIVNSRKFSLDLLGFDTSSMTDKQINLLNDIMINWPSDLSEERINLILTAISLLGKPVTYSQSERYVGFDNDVPNSLDCSSFVTWSFKHSGYDDFPKTYTGNFVGGEVYGEKFLNKIDESELMPGDVALFSKSTGGGLVNHTGIYLGTDSNGVKQYINCLNYQNSNQDVRLVNTDNFRYFRSYTGFNDTNSTNI